MKRCPECRRDYYDDSLLYCLDDGANLLDGPAYTPDFAGDAPTLPHGRIAYPAERPRVAGSFRTVGTAAYDFYLRGKMIAHSENQEKNAAAIEILEEVVAIDPAFAPAFADLGRAYNIKANFWASGDEKKKLFDDAKFAVQKALALEPNLAAGHFVRGAILWTHAERFPHEQAVRSFKRAIDIDPGYEEAHHHLGLVYYHIGLFDKGEAEVQWALDLDPVNALARFRLGAIELYRTNYARALSILKTVPSEANPAIIDRAVASILFTLGKYQEAKEIVDNFLAAYSDEGGNITSVKAMLLAREGRATEAGAAIKHAIDIGESYQHFHHTTYNIASAYVLLNRTNEALEWLQFTADDGFPCYPFFEKDKSLDPLRRDERFIQMMADMKEQWEHYMSVL